MSLWLSVYPCLSVYLSLSICVCLSVYLCLFVSFFFLSVCLCVSLSVYLSLCLSACLSVYVCLSVYLCLYICGSLRVKLSWTWRGKRHHRRLCLRQTGTRPSYRSLSIDSRWGNWTETYFSFPRMCPPQGTEGLLLCVLRIESLVSPPATVPPGGRNKEAD